MCGFAGIIDLHRLAGEPAERDRVLGAMGAQLARRGPDDETHYDDGVLSLVFRRLSIIDLAGGRQPLWNEDGTVLAVVNGEIYNFRELRRELESRHRFRSASDSEVVLHLYEEYGADFLQHLNGMFAIAIWDTRERRLLLARDRLGIKPLFYACLGERLLFGSELKALLAHPDCPRDFDWTGFQARRFQSADIPTFITGVESLPGGQYLELRPGQSPRRAAYWALEQHFVDDGNGRSGPSPEDCVGRYGELLEDSIHRHLMSDVPVGLFLSGGLDSVVIATVAARQLPSLQCFTVVERNTVKVGDVAQARISADKLGLPFHPVLYDGRTFMDELDYSLADFEFMVWAVESPRYDMGWLFKFELGRYARTACPGLKVILLGQGADEFAGGYSRGADRDYPSWESFQQQLRAFRLNSHRLELGVPSHLLPLLADDFPREFNRQRLPGYHEQMLQYVYSLQRYNLWHEDRTSSAMGLEARVPFLDHRLVEFLAGIPLRLHAELFYNKQILRRYAATVCPEFPPDKMKVGFFSSSNRPGDNPVADFMTSLLRRVYPSFRDKYLGVDDAIFAIDKLDAMARQMVSGQPHAPGLSTTLLECMAISVFRRQCRELHRSGPPSGPDVPSPLRLARGNVLADPVAR